MQSIDLWIIAAVSIITAIAASAVYKRLSNQDAIKKVNSTIKAYIFELRLFNHDLLQLISAVFNIFIHLGRYLFLQLKPISILIIPVILILQALHLFYSYSPLQKGMHTNIILQYVPGTVSSHKDVEFSSSSDIKVLSGPVFSRDKNELSWKIGVTGGVENSYVAFKVKDFTIKKAVKINSHNKAIYSVSRTNNSVIDYLLIDYKRIESNSYVNSIKIQYPEKRFEIFGYRIHWLILYLILTALSGIIIMKIFKISW